MAHARCAAGAAASQQHRHHRERCEHAGAVRQWREAGLGGRELHRAPQTRRCVHVCRPLAGAGAHAADDGLCAHGPQRQRCAAALERRAHAAVEHAGRCHAAPAGAGRARRVRIARDALRAALAGVAGCVVGPAHTQPPGGRGAAHARGLAPVPVPAGGAAGAPGAGGPAGVEGLAAGAQHIFDCRQRLRAGAAVGQTGGLARAAAAPDWRGHAQHAGGRNGGRAGSRGAGQPERH